MSTNSKKAIAVLKAHLHAAGDVGAHSFSKARLTQLLAGKLDVGSVTVNSALEQMAADGLIKVSHDAEAYVEVVKPEFMGPASLIRSFCKKFYGEVSPVVDKKMTQALLKRFGAPFQIEDKDVQASLKDLHEEGLIKLVGREDAYFKMLGAE